MILLDRANEKPPTHPADSLSAARLQQVFNQETGSTLRLAMLVIGVSALVQVPVHAHRDIGAAPLMALYAALVGVACLCAWLWTKVHPVPAQLNNVAFAIVIGVASADTIYNQAVVGDPLLTINITLVLIATGLCIVSLRWVLAVTLPAMLLWFAVAAPPLGSPDWGTAATGVVFGFCAGLIVNSGRRKALARLEQVTQEAEHASVTDSLTQVYNRRGLALVAGQLVRTARRNDAEMGALLVDVDRFKAVNDEYGHHAGDRVLMTVANALRRSGRDSDVVARWGGDEFVVITLGEPPTAEELARRIAHYLAADPSTQRDRTAVTVSVGAASARLREPDDIDGLIAAADADMYVRRAQLRLSTGASSGRILPTRN